MRKILSITLLFSLILPYLLNVAIIVNFKINQEFIAKVLCIDKDKPESNCHGTCQLSKQLSETDNDDPNKEQNKLKTEVETNLFLRSHPKSVNTYALDENEGDANGYYCEFYSSTYLSDIFKPPESHFIS